MNSRAPSSPVENQQGTPPSLAVHPAMGNKFYSPDEHRTARVDDLFATIAHRYDLINDLQSFWFHRWWKRKLIRMAGIQKGEKALDLCCGTGDVSFKLAEAGAEVTGLDYSQAMLDVAGRRARSDGGAVQPQFIRGDAMRTGFPPESFDVVTISYGLRNLPDVGGGLDEITRLLKPGGRVLILDFGKPSWGPWRSLYFHYLRFWVPRFGKLFFGDADTHGYIHESLLHYPAQRGVDAALRERGYGETRIVEFMGGAMSINYAVKTGGAKRGTA